MEFVAAEDGVEVFEKIWGKEELDQMEKDRTYGRCGKPEELVSYARQRQTVNPKYFVEKSQKKE